MLVLTRKHQETIRIGDHITITVLKTKGKTVRLGIEAPMEVPVIRGELSFAGKPVDWQDVASDEGEEAAQSVNVDGSHADRIRAHWPTKLHATSASTRVPGSGAAHVSLQRVSREQVGQVLPKLVAGSSPLREMLDRRSATA